MDETLDLVIGTRGTVPWLGTGHSTIGAGNAIRVDKNVTGEHIILNFFKARAKRCYQIYDSSSRIVANGP